MSKTLTMEFTGRSIPFLVTLTALCLSITVATSCRFLVVETGEAEPVAYGLFRLGETLEGQVCGTFRHYTAVINQANSKLPAQQPRTEGISSAQKAAQFGGIFSCILGFTATMLLFLSFFFQRFLSRCVWRIALPILLISAAVVQSITFSAFGDDACQSKCTSNTDACNVVTCSFGEGANRALAAFVLYLFIGISIIFYPKRTTPLVKFLTDDESRYVATNNKTQILVGARNSKKKVDDIEMAEQEQFDETDNEPEPEATDWIHSGNDSDQLAAPGKTVTSSTTEGNWPAFGDNVALTDDTARPANDIPGSMVETKVATTTQTRSTHYMPPSTANSTTTPTTGSMGLSSEDHAIDFSMSPQLEGTLLHDDSGLARQRRHKKKSSSKRHIEHHSERRSERHSERTSERNSERPRMKKEES